MHLFQLGLPSHSLLFSLSPTSPSLSTYIYTRVVEKYSPFSSANFCSWRLLFTGLCRRHTGSPNPAVVPDDLQLNPVMLLKSAPLEKCSGSIVLPQEACQFSCVILDDHCYQTCPLQGTLICKEFNNLGVESVVLPSSVCAFPYLLPADENKPAVMTVRSKWQVQKTAPTETPLLI